MPVYIILCIQAFLFRKGLFMSEIKSCPHCGSTRVEYLNLDIHPSFHCKDCNILMTKLTDEQLQDIHEQFQDLKDIKSIIDRD